MSHLISVCFSHFVKIKVKIQDQTKNMKFIIVISSALLIFGKYYHKIAQAQSWWIKYNILAHPPVLFMNSRFYYYAASAAPSLSSLEESKIEDKGFATCFACKKFISFVRSKITENLTKVKICAAHIWCIEE